MAQKIGKIIEIDYDFVLAQSDEIVCLALTRKTVAILLPLLEFQEWKTRWYSPSKAEIALDTIKALVDAARAQLITGEDDCMCCPEQSEILRQLVVLQNNAAAAAQAVQYDGTPQSMGDNIPTNFDGGVDTEQPNLEIDYALCRAVSEIMAAAVVDAGNRLGIGAAAGAAMTAALWVLNPVLGLLAGIVWAISVETLENALEDTQAMKNVLCCILRGLRGVEISQQALIDAAANSGCEFEGNEGTYQLIFETFVAQEQNYIAWLAHFSSTLALAQSGIQYDACECCDNGGDLRLDYLWFYGDGGYVQTRNQSMRREGNILYITMYKQVYMVNDHEFGFKLYSPSGCCTRLRILTPNFLTQGSGDFYDPVVPQREGQFKCGAENAFNGVGEWCCVDLLSFRFAPQSTSYPAWLDAEIAIELDPEFAC